MKTTLLVLLLFSFSLFLNAQTAVVFDGTDIPPTLTAWAWGQSTIDVEAGSGPEGDNALIWVQGDEWGEGWTGIGFTVDPAFDLSAVWEDQAATFMLKCEEGTGDLRIQYENGANKIGNVFTPIADNQWHEYVFPLSQMELQEGSTEFNPVEVGTVGLMAEASGVPGKKILIADWYVTTEQTLVLFNGIAIPTNLEPWTWGNSALEVVEGAGQVEGGNAIKWTQAEGQTGFGFTVTPFHDLSEVWGTDSLKFKMKAEEGIDTMTIMFYDDTRLTIGTHFAPIADNEWHNYALPLSEFVMLAGETEFNTAAIQFVEVNTGLFVGNGVEGKSVYITDWWTGNPVFDVIPPSAPSDLSATAGEYVNLVAWTDVAGEQRERYNIYYSKNPITDVDAAEVVELKISEGVQSVEHSLLSPVNDADVTYYYAITATDAAGNTSEPFSLSGPVTNTAKGTTTISLEAPGATFSADGDLSEWAEITPIHMAPSGGGYVVTGTVIDDDADLSIDAYLAVDADYLYVAFEAEDDVVAITGSEWANDCPDLYIGLYNWHGPKHLSFRRGAEPDYHFRFAYDRLFLDGLASGDSLLIPGDNYFWAEKFPSGYVIEARISLQELADRLGDEKFVPVEGYRIPIDFDIIDSDEPDVREGILCYSPTNNANSWSAPTFWTYTWIGNLSEPSVGVNDDRKGPDTYSLDQNYPNPFNPATKITYTLERPGLVTLKVYDILGSQVATLVNEQQESGLHTVNFNAAGLTSGIYFYEISSNEFSSVKKMLLVK